MQTIEEEEGVGSDFQDNPLHFEILNLRRRWELASVLHFLDVRYSRYSSSASNVPIRLRFQIILVTFFVIQVFSPLLGNDLKVTAQEIEIGLVKPNASLANLHIQLLKVSFRSCFQYSSFVSFKLFIDFIQIQMFAFCGLRFKTV